MSVISIVMHRKHHQCSVIIISIVVIISGSICIRIIIVMVASIRVVIITALLIIMGHHGAACELEGVISGRDAVSVVVLGGVLGELAQPDQEGDEEREGKDLDPHEA